MNSVIILGLPGSGKSTYGKKLAEKLGTIHISFGELYREMKEKKELEEYKGKKLDEILLGRLMELVNPSEMEWIVIDGPNIAHFELINNLFPIRRTINMNYDFSNNEERKLIIERMLKRARNDDENEEMIIKRIIIKDVLYRKNKFMLNKFIKCHKKRNNLIFEEISAFCNLDEIKF